MEVGLGLITYQEIAPNTVIVATTATPTSIVPARIAGPGKGTEGLGFREKARDTNPKPCSPAA
jgi:hypothetical protein